MSKSSSPLPLPWLSTSLAVLAIAGCVRVAPSALTLASTKTIAVGTAATPIDLSGVALAPAALIANNSAGVVSNNGNGLIANNGSGLGGHASVQFRVADDSPWQPVAGAPVTLYDPLGHAIAGIGTTQTDASGHFTLHHVPSGVTAVVQIAGTGFQLASVVSAQTAGTTVEVDPASTLVTAQLQVTQALQSSAALAATDLAQVTQTVKADLLADQLTPDLSSTTAAARSFAKLAAHHPDLGSESAQIARAAAASPGPAATASGTPAATASAAPSPTAPPSAGPSPVASPSASASPQPGATPTEGPTAPAPSPSASAASEGAVRNQFTANDGCMECNSPGASLGGIVLASGTFMGGTLANADFAGASLKGAIFNSVNLRGADFAGADLTGASFIGCDLTGANLKGATVTDVTWMGATLSNALWTNGSTCAVGATGPCTF